MLTLPSPTIVHTRFNDNNDMKILEQYTIQRLRVSRFLNCTYGTK